MQRIYLAGLIFVLVGLQISGANNVKKKDVIKRSGSEKYCEIQTKLCNFNFHPLCEEPAKIYERSNAIQIEFLELNDTDKGNLLMEINKFRNKLAAGAIAGFKSGSNFQIVKWSSQFAKMAEANEKYNSFCNKISLNNSEFLESEEFLDEDNVGPDFYKNAVKQKVADSYSNSLWNTLFRAEFNRIGCALSNDRSDSSYKLFCYTNRNEVDDASFDVVKAYKRGIPCTDCSEAKCHKKFTNLCDVSENLQDPGDLEQILLNYDILDDDVDDIPKIQPNATNKYCQIQAKYCGIDLHPLCKEPAKVYLTPNAVNIEFHELSDADKSFILLKINKFRNKLAAGNITGHKSSSNIRIVNWSPQFANLAKANDKYNSFCNKISLNNSEFVESEEFLDEDNEGPEFYKNAVKRKVLDSYGNSLWNTLFRAEFNRIGCALSNDRSDSSYKLFCYTNRNEVDDASFDVVKAYKRGIPCTDCSEAKCHKKFTNLCDVSENLQDPGDLEQILLNYDILDDDVDDIPKIQPNATNKYCQIQTKYCGIELHPLCKEPAKVYLTPNAVNIEFHELSDADKSFILLKINKFRNKLAAGNITGHKSSSNIRIVNWSPQFANLAKANDKYNSFCNKISLNNSEFLDGEEFLDEDNVGPDFYKNAVKQKVADSYGNSLWNTLFRAEFNRIGCALSNDRSDSSYKLFCYTNRNEVDDASFDVVKAYKRGIPCTDCSEAKCHKKFTNLCDVSENLQDPGDLEQILLNYDILDDDVDDIPKIQPNATNKYCQIQAKYCGIDLHPLCKEPPKVYLTTNAVNIEFRELSDTDKSYILLKINKFRNKLAAGNITGHKSSSNIRIVNWSPQFAKLAEANDKYNSFCNKISLNNSEFVESEEFLDEDNVGPDFYKNAVKQKVADSYGNSLWNTLFRAEFNRIGCALSNDRSDSSYKLFCYTNRNEVDDATFDVVKAYKRGITCTDCSEAKCHKQFTNLCDVSENLQDPGDLEQILLNYDILDDDVDDIPKIQPNATNKYCQIQAKYCGIDLHPLCKEPAKVYLTPNAVNIEFHELSDADKSFILLKINKFRNKLAAGNITGHKSSSNIRIVNWSPQFANLAKANDKYNSFCNKISLNNSEFVESEEFLDEDNEGPDFYKNAVKRKVLDSYGNSLWNTLFRAEFNRIGCALSNDRSDSSYKLFCYTNRNELDDATFDVVKAYKRGISCTECGEAKCHKKFTNLCDVSENLQDPGDLEQILLNYDILDDDVDDIPKIQPNATNKYCQIQAKYCGIELHPLCKEPADVFLTTNAVNIEFHELSDADKSFILLKINKFRNKLAAGTITGYKSSSNIRIVNWSPQFANLAKANDKYNSFCNKISLNNSEFVESEEFLDEDNEGPDFYKNAVKRKVLDSYGNSLWNTLFRAEFNRIGCALSNDRSDSSYKLFCYTNRNEVDDATFDVVKAYKRGISCTDCGEAKCHKKFTNLCDVSENLQDPGDLEQILLNYDILDDDVDDIPKIQPNATNKYCQIQTKYCGIDLHPLCKEPADVFLTTNAVNIEFHELSDADKSFILLKINKFRNKLAAGTIAGYKSSSNIRIVNWSSQFAKLAEANDKYNSFCNKISLNNSEFLDGEEFLDEDNVGPDFYKNAVKQKVADSYSNSLWNTLFRAEFNRIGCALSNDRSDSSYKLFCYTNRNEVDDATFDVVKAYKRGISCTECGEAKCHEKFTNLCDVSENLQDPGDLEQILLNYDILDDDIDDIPTIQPNATNKYCQIQTKYCGIDLHPLCKEPADVFLTTNAVNIEFHELSDTDKSYILLKINKFRNKLAAGTITGYKSSSNIRIVNWSPQFAKLAEANDKYNSFCNKISLNNSEFLDGEEFLDEDNVGPDFYKNAVKQKVADSYSNSLWNTLFRAEFNRIGCALSNDMSDSSYKLFCYTNRNEVDDATFDVVKAYKRGISCTECGEAECHEKFTNLCDVSENLQDPGDLEQILLNYDILDDDVDDIPKIQPNATNKYCQIQAKYCGIDLHPLCKEPADVFLTTNAVNIEFHELSDADKSFILLKINKFRNKLAAGTITGYKSSSNIRIVNWSPQFAKLAEANDKYNSFCNKISLNNSEFLDGEEFLDEDNVGPDFYKNAVKQKVADSYGNSLWNILFRAEFNRIGCTLSNDRSDNLYKLFCYTNRNELNDAEFDMVKGYKEGKPCTECGKLKCHEKFQYLCDVDPDENLPDFKVNVDDDEDDDEFEDEDSNTIYKEVDGGVIEDGISPNVTKKYCVIQSKYCKSDFHPLCKEPAKIFQRPNVAQIKFLKLSDADKTSILLEINKFRDELAAGAITGYKSGSNFRIVNWSPQFAKLAEANDKYNSFCNKISVDNSEFLEGEEFLDEDRNFYKTELIGKVNDSYGNNVWNILFRAEFNRIGCALSNDKSDGLYKLFCYTNRNGDDAYKEGRSCTQCGGAKCHLIFNNLCDIQDPDDIDPINKKHLDIDVDSVGNESNLILYILIGLAVFIVVIILIFLFFCLHHHMKEFGESYEIKQKQPKRSDMFAD